MWSSDAGRAVFSPLALAGVAGSTDRADKEEAGEEEIVALFSTDDSEVGITATDGLI